MVSIEFGGGPTDKQRQKFAGSDFKNHIPGYMGFCPQFNFKCGKTFGLQTALLTKELSYFKGPGSIFGKDASIEPGTMAMMLPKARGDNKLIENLIPGYSGDIPGFNYDFGRRFTNITNDCIGNFVQSYLKRDKELKELNELAKTPSCFVKIKPSEKVKKEIDFWIDEQEKKNGISNKKEMTEPGIPGYTGYIPRELVTEAALGHRYTKGTERCLKIFDEEISSHFKNLQTPARLPSENSDIRAIEVKPCSERCEKYTACSNKVGCIPKYTGFVPKMRDEVGKTFGHTTLNLHHCQKHEGTEQGMFNEFHQGPDEYKVCTNRVGCIPKYTGFLPKVKEQVGRRFGATTRDLAYCQKHEGTETQEPEPLLDDEVDYKVCTDRVGCIPRYTGFVPRLREQCGQTFGNTTRELQHCQKNEGAESQEVWPLTQAPEEFKACTNKVGAIVNYTGHIPDNKRQFGKSFGVTTRDLAHCQKHAEDGAEQEEKPNEETPVEFHSCACSKQASMMANYTGHIPQIKHEFGHTFGATTRHLACCPKNKESPEMDYQCQPERNEEKPTSCMNMDCDDKFKPCTKKLGIIPHYAGFVPDLRNRVGKTYTAATRDLTLCQKHEHP